MIQNQFFFHSLTFSCSHLPKLAVGARLIMTTRKLKEKRKKIIIMIRNKEKLLNCFKNMFQFMPVVGIFFAFQIFDIKSIFYLLHI